MTRFDLLLADWRPMTYGGPTEKSLPTDSQEICWKGEMHVHAGCRSTSSFPFKKVWRTTKDHCNPVVRSLSFFFLERGLLLQSDERVKQTYDDAEDILAS